MIPIKLSLRNFMPYREASLSFEGIHIACLCGDNGNGKSALLDAITWALWGKARSRSDDELIHLGMTEMEVEFEFAVGQKHYRTIRKRSKPKASRGGQSLLDFQIATNGTFKSIAGNSIAETERKIVEVLHMDYDTFINSAYIMQGRADEFTKAQPAKRKEVLANILGLSRYDELEERAKSYARSRERGARDIESAIAQIDKELTDKGMHEAELRRVSDTVARLEKEWQKLQEGVRVLEEQKHTLDLKMRQQGEIEKHIKQAQDAVISFESRVQEHRKRIEKYESVVAAYDAEASKILGHLDEMGVKEGQLEGKRIELQDVSSKIHNLVTANAQLREEMTELKGKIDMLSAEEANCPLCGTELSVEGRTRILDNYQAQGVAKKELFRVNEEEKNRLDAAGKVLKSEIGALERTVREGRELWARRAAALDKDYKEAQGSLPGEQEALQKAEQDLLNWRDDFDAESKKREMQKAELAGAPEVETKLGASKKDFNDITRRLEQSRQLMGSVNERLERCVHLEQNRGEKLALLEAAIKEQKIYEELALAFGKKGIQAMLIENALPEIEEEANRLLSRMTDNRMHVKIETQRSRKAKEGEPVETLDINISDELGMRRYEMYSGGEAFRIDFALRIALSKLLAHRAGAPLPTLIIDEGFGSQDASGREHLVEAINSIQSDFEKVLVITHIEELKEAFQVRIEVDKTPSGSVIKVT